MAGESRHCHQRKSWRTMVKDGADLLGRQTKSKKKRQFQKLQTTAGLGILLLLFVMVRVMMPGGSQKRIMVTEQLDGIKL